VLPSSKRLHFRSVSVTVLIFPYRGKISLYLSVVSNSITLQERHCKEHTLKTEEPQFSETKNLYSPTWYNSPQT